MTQVSSGPNELKKYDSIDLFHNFMLHANYIR